MELEEDGLIEVRVIDEERYLPTSQLAELERYTHLYYDLSINIAGIDAIHHMLERIELLQQEVRTGILPLKSVSGEGKRKLHPLLFPALFIYFYISVFTVVSIR